MLIEVLNVIMFCIFRYTEEDTDYVKTTSKPIPPCPCLTDYYTRSRQQSDNRSELDGTFSSISEGHPHKPSLHQLATPPANFEFDSLIVFSNSCFWWCY